MISQPIGATYSSHRRQGGGGLHGRPQLLPLASALAFAVTVLLAACGSNNAAPSPTSTLVATATQPSTSTPGASPTLVPISTATPGIVARPTATSNAPYAQVVRFGPSDRNVITLTFDAGSDTGNAAQILDTLSANGIVAAFGMTGQWAERNPELLQRIVREGHLLINHTYDHGSFTGYSTDAPPLSRAQRWDELERTEAIIQQIAGVSTKPYFRPPYGDYDHQVNIDVYAKGYTYNIMWTVDSFGWRGISAGEIVQRCLDQAAPGAIYIFHVGAASQDAAALQRVIDGLRAAGYDFVPLSAFAPR